MTETLPPDLQQFVQQEIARGDYSSEADVLAAGLRLLRERERRLQALRDEIRPALDRLDRGQGIELADESLDAFFEDIVVRGDRRLQAERDS
jgi:antitoxin ParD1/3/4